jgi:hypothetical protein
MTCFSPTAAIGCWLLLIQPSHDLSFLQERKTIIHEKDMRIKKKIFSCKDLLVKISKLQLPDC